MKYATLLFVALIGLSAVQCNNFNGRFLATSTEVPENITVTWALTLDCGVCIKAGYVYCTNATEGTQYTTKPDSYCCKDNTTTNCKYQSWSNMTCSNSYSNKAYSKFLCPYMSSNCGSNNTISLSTTGESQKISANMTAG
jgi:hypothetical protein